VNDTHADPVEAFYDRHPYPPPVADLDALARQLDDRRADRVAHHLIWPHRPVDSIQSALIAGCGTSQAVRYAMRHQQVRVVGIDVSATSLDHTRTLVARHDVSNLSVRQLSIEDVAELGQTFDHVVCTGVLHHLADPPDGLRELREVLAPGGAITLMVYAPYGRAGVYLFQDYCRRLGIGTSPDELADLVATIREVPTGHPIRRLLKESRDYLDDDALADALCNPRDRAYSVPELLELIDHAGLRFGRWERQAPYLPDCGAISETPHATRIAALAHLEQYALVELFRGTIARHTAICFGADDATSGSLDFGRDTVRSWIPIRVPTAIAVEERLPAGVAAALINRAHTDPDLVLFADRSEYAIFEAIDGERSIGELGPKAAAFVERLWRHDLVACDTTRQPTNTTEDE
jgi:SAM-dependent methyltransferase